MNEFTLRVLGTPAPQGSKRAFKHKTTGKLVVVEQQHDRVKSWRQAILDAVENAPGFDCPVSLSITFLLERKAGHYGTGRNAGILRPSAPQFPGAMPDLSKLVRATEDALTNAGVWRDDGQVVTLHVAKRWADPVTLPGAIILIKEARL
jgi:Holliday junction resolvase RusA-like endonuclease